MGGEKKFKKKKENILQIKKKVLIFALNKLDEEG